MCLFLLPFALMQGCASVGAKAFKIATDPEVIKESADLAHEIYKEIQDE